MERGCGCFPELKFRHQVNEIPRGKLLPVIVYDTGMCFGIEFLRPGHEYFNVQALHRSEKAPNENLATESSRTHAK